MHQALYQVSRFIFINFKVVEIRMNTKRYGVVSFIAAIKRYQKYHQATAVADKGRGYRDAK